MPSSPPFKNEIHLKSKLLPSTNSTDKLVNILTLVLIPMIVGINILGIFMFRNFIVENQRGALVARADNRRRQEQSQGYIKCIILLKYDNPSLTPNSSRDEVEAALDKCATKDVQ